MKKPLPRKRKRKSLMVDHPHPTVSTTTSAPSFVPVSTPLVIPTKSFWRKFIDWLK